MARQTEKKSIRKTTVKPSRISPAPSSRTGKAIPTQSKAGMRGESIQRESLSSEHEILFPLVWDKSADGLRLTDSDGIIVLVNAAFCKMVGKKKEEIEGKPMSVIYKTAHRGHILTQHRNRFSSRTVSKRLVRKMVLWNGEEKWFEISNSFFQPKRQKPLLLGIFRDITDRKRAESDLRRAHDELEDHVKERTSDLAIINASLKTEIAGRQESERVLMEERRMFIAGPSIMFRRKATKGWGIEYVSPNIKDQFGYSVEDIAGRSLSYASIVHPEDLERLTKEISLAEKTTMPFFEQEYRIKGADGEYRWIYDFTTIIRDARGRILYHLGYVQDISDRKRVEEEQEHYTERIQKQKAAIVKLATHESLMAGDVGRYSELVTEIVADTLNVHRASIWFLSEDAAHLLCINLFDSRMKNHSSGNLLYARDYPLYFKSLGDELVVDAHDACSDPRTAEFCEKYLIPTGITSKLDASIRISGKLVGVVCQELMGPLRHWTEDECVFVGQVADHVATVIANNQRKKIETEMSMLAHAMKSISECVTITDLNDRLIFVNDAYERMYGYTRSESLGEKTDMILSRSIPRWMNEEITSRTLHGSWQGELMNRRKDGTEFPINLSTSIIKDDEGNPRALIGIASDITERKKAEDELQFTNTILQTQLQTAIDGILVTDNDGGVVLHNQRFAEMWNLPAHLLGMKLDEQIIRMISSQLVRPNEFYDKIQYLYQHRYEKSFCEIELRGGTTFERYSAPMLGSDGKYYGRVWYFRDLTSKKQADRDLKEAEERYIALFERSLDCVYIIDFDGKILDANPAALTLFGYTRDELPTMHYSSILDHSQARIVGRMILEVRTTGTQKEKAEIRAKRKDGSTVDLEVQSSLIYRAGVPYAIQGIARDITQRKRTEEALRSSEERYRSLFSRMLDGVYRSTHDGRFVDVNPAMVSMFGYSNRDELMSVDIKKDLYFAPEERDSLFLDTDQQRTEIFRMRRKDGSEMWVEDHGQYVHDEKGAVSFHEGILRDITERLLVEQALRESEKRYRALNEELEQRIKERTTQLELANKELEAFSYSVSHDLRAPLRSISGFSQALAEDYSRQLDATGKDYLYRVRTASHRMEQLVDDMLILSRVTRQDLRRITVDLSQLAHTIIAELRIREPDRIVEFVIAEELRVKADENLMRIVLQNLLENSWKFTSKHPAARIEIGMVTREDQNVFFVRDDGAGFDMEYVGRLFGAFQRLHTPLEFEGTGVGLAIVQRIVHRHGGRVWAEGAVEKGATVFFTLS